MVISKHGKFWGISIFNVGVVHTKFVMDGQDKTMSPQERGGTLRLCKYSLVLTERGRWDRMNVYIYLYNQSL